MKISYKNTTLIIILIQLLLFSSCDEVSLPYIQDKGNSNGGDTATVRKVLIEDYTGFKCGNCPKAHTAAHNLIEQYGENVIVMAVHASFFANPDPQHPYDFRTTTGTEWDEFFGISALGLPKGMVNRLDYPLDHIKNYDAWQQYIDGIISQEPIVSIKITPDYNENSGKIDISVDYEYTETLEEYHNLNVCIIEDSIVQYQTDYASDPKDIYDYVHNHVLRLALNGSWGDKLTDRSAIKTYSYTIPSESDWRPEKLKIIAFISDVENTYEVLQAEEVDLNINE
jgi:thiol-disulfide isomerase/thioredoxin